MSRRLAMSGKMASGKDTLAEAALTKLGLRWHRINLADAIRNELQECYDLAKESDDKVRARLEPWVSNAQDEDIAEQIVSICKGNTDAWTRSSDNRLALQQLALLGRRNDPGVWVRKHAKAVRAWDAAADTDDRVLTTTDVREPDEVASLHRLKFIIMRVNVKPETQVARLDSRDKLRPDHSMTHPNETALDTPDPRTAGRFSLIVDNDRDPEEAAEKIAALLRKEWKI